MTEPTAEQPITPEYIELKCGARKSSIQHGTWDITNGQFSREKPYGIRYAPGLGVEDIWLSGETLLFPDDRAVGLIVGRAAELKIDADLIPYKQFVSQYSEEAPELMQVLMKLKTTVGEWDLEPLRLIPDFSDPYISRYHLQISYHPDGVTIVTYDPLLGRSYGERGERLNFPTLLRQYVEKPVTEELSWIVNNGSKTLSNGDVVILKGGKRIYCLRYFDKNGDSSTRIIKESFPRETTIAQIHQRLMVQ